MIKYHSFKAQHIILSLAIFVVGAFFSVLISRADNLPFGSQLTTMFPGIDANYSSIHFQYGGNDFAGMIFRTNATNLSTPEQININGGSQYIQCSQRINGIYYNNQRGRRLRPLDTGDLAILINGNPEYNMLQVTGGFYTDCTGVFGGYYPNANEVYGQITHVRSGTTFQLAAGLNYNFTGNSISGTSFGRTLYGVSNVASGYLFDSYGGIGYVGGTGQGTMLLGSGICLGFTPPTLLTVGTDGVFTCHGNDTGNSITGYILNIRSGTSLVYNDLQSTNVNAVSRNTGSALPLGTYQTECIVLGIGIGAGSTCNNTTIAMTVTGIQQGGSGNTCGLAGNMNIVTVPGLITQASTYTPNYYYVRTTNGINFQIWSIMPSYYSITSSGITNTITGYYNNSYNPPFATAINTGTINLNISNGQAQVNTLFYTGTCSYNVTNRITIDTNPPTAPTSLSPTNGSGICYVGNTIFSRTGAIDSGVGITQYNYKIYTNAGFTSLILNGMTGGTSVDINASQLGTGYFSGTYYRSVQAIDGLGQTGAMLTGAFNVGIGYCSNSGDIMIHGTIPRLRNADLNKEYLSDPFTVDGLPGPIIAYLSTGILYVNGTGHASSGYINNGDELNIKLKSSTQYDTTVSTIFYVGPRYATYYITTKSLTGYTPTSGCVLDTGEELLIQNIFDMMRSTYDNDPSTLSDFLFTIQSMLQDETDLTNNCSLSYLLDTVNSYIMNSIEGNTTDQTTHEAPNCKKYQIKFVSSRSGYTSPDFKHKKTYFATFEAITRYIDSKNPGDCNVNTYEDLPTFDNSSQSGYYTAPNGRLYQIKSKTSSGTTLYYSPDFIKAKNFENEDNLYAFIDTNNPIEDVRDHTVDTSFQPLDYVAPNSKEYRIYGTDQGFMSYKLLKVQYFDTLEEIEAYIDKNNPVAY